MDTSQKNVQKYQSRHLYLFSSQSQNMLSRNFNILMTRLRRFTWVPSVDFCIWTNPLIIWKKQKWPMKDQPLFSPRFELSSFPPSLHVAQPEIVVSDHSHMTSTKGGEIPQKHIIVLISCMSVTVTTERGSKILGFNSIGVWECDWLSDWVPDPNSLQNYT